MNRTVASLPAEARGDSGMFADMKEHSGSFEKTWWVAGLVAILVGSLLAAAPVSAQGPPRDGTVYLHSATSGELGGGRLTLHGVSRRVTWAHHSGRSGVMAVKRMHRRLFSAKTPEATGTLHVAGHHGGDELTFKLSRPRYNRARHTVSYRAKPLNNKPLSRRAVRAAGAAGSFGAASLTIQAAPQPSLGVEQSTYPCPADSSTTCWGTLSGSGLPARSQVTGFAPQVPGNTGQGVDIDVQVDGYGNVNVQLNLLCNNVYGVTNPNIGIDATSVTPSFSVSAPGSCG
jgi:hypothetical protein